MPTVDFLPFATGAGANVESQASYASDPSTAAGFSAGLAQSQKLNKCWRQSSFISAALANLVSQQLGVDVLDDGNLTGFTANLQAALVALQPRKVLYGPTTFYVNSQIGSDNFEGTSPTSPWLTLQNAANELAFEYDCNSQNITVQIADGSYVGFVMPSALLGQNLPSQLIFQGNMTNPGNVLITPNPASGVCVGANNTTLLQLQGMRFTAPTAVFVGAFSDGIWVNNTARLHFQTCDFGACLGAQIHCTQHSLVSMIGGYSISGGATNHILVEAQSTYKSASVSTPEFVGASFNVTINNNPAYTESFIRCRRQSFCWLWDGGTPLLNWVGAATGVRWHVQSNSFIDTEGAPTGSGSLTWIPGSVAGITDAGSYAVFI
jgi:hypothetical protein